MCVLSRRSSTLLQPHVRERCPAAATGLAAVLRRAGGAFGSPLQLRLCSISLLCMAQNRTRVAKLVILAATRSQVGNTRKPVMIGGKQTLRLHQDSSIPPLEILHIVSSTQLLAVHAPGERDPCNDTRISLRSSSPVRGVQQQQPRRSTPCW